jgi:hypothetical protein
MRNTILTLLPLLANCHHPDMSSTSETQQKPTNTIRARSHTGPASGTATSITEPPPPSRITGNCYSGGVFVKSIDSDNIVGIGVYSDPNAVFPHTRESHQVALLWDATHPSVPPIRFNEGGYQKLEAIGVSGQWAIGSGEQCDLTNHCSRVQLRWDVTNPTLEPVAFNQQVGVFTTATVSAISGSHVVGQVRAPHSLRLTSSTSKPLSGTPSSRVPPHTF